MKKKNAGKKAPLTWRGDLLKGAKVRLISDLHRRMKQERKASLVEKNSKSDQQ